MAKVRLRASLWRPRRSVLRKVDSELFRVQKQSYRNLLDFGALSTPYLLVSLTTKASSKKYLKSVIIFDSLRETTTTYHVHESVREAVLTAVSRRSGDMHGE